LIGAVRRGLWCEWVGYVLGGIRAGRNMRN